MVGNRHHQEPAANYRNMLLALWKPVKIYRNPTPRRNRKMVGMGFARPSSPTRPFGPLLGFLQRAPAIRHRANQRTRRMETRLESKSVKRRLARAFLPSVSKGLVANPDLDSGRCPALPPLLRAKARRRGR
jgi:hypothetical protein